MTVRPGSVSRWPAMERARYSKSILWLSVFSSFLVLCSCARQKVVSGRRSVPSERPGVYHVVEKHQTLYRICKTYGVDIKGVASLNGIADRARIQVGQKIFIPNAGKVLKVDIYIDDVVAESAEGEKIASRKPDFIWPVRGSCTNVFDEDERKRHQGIDISAQAGAPVKASGSGMVIYSGNTIRGYGNLIILRHSNEFVTVYAHNQVNLVDEGTSVEKGQIIGRVGQSGKASGPHLHFEIRKNNKAVDPHSFLK
jgi:murein DD-endopeptidase MepM/ murein hydrolase activator NlpD